MSVLLDVKDPRFFVENVIGPVEDDGGKIRKMTLNFQDYCHIRKFGRDVLDVNTIRETLRQGFVGTMYNISLWVSKNVQEDHFLLEVEKDGRTTAGQWCAVCRGPYEGPWCEEPNCVVAHVMET